MQTESPQPIITLLALCTGNSARSILTEALFNVNGRGYFRAFSAGSHPKGAVHPLALEQLHAQKLPSDAYRSKSWREFNTAGAPTFDVVLTLCGDAADEVCPALNGDCDHVHWGLPDPAAISESDAMARVAFSTCFALLKARVEHMADHAEQGASREELVRRLHALGESTPRWRRGSGGA